MVKFREFTIEIVSRKTDEPHPEFAHPETSQYKSNGPILNSLAGGGGLAHAGGSSSKSDLILGRTPSISVYIPSIAATRFWIRWSVDQPQDATHQYYFFKLFMNGRHITSWGTDPRTRPTGQCMRALFQPEKSRCVVVDGVGYRPPAPEHRPFYFDDQSMQTSANDGGVIQVRIFRAYSRKRLEHQLMEFRGQAQYGINLPSAGLVSNPEDIRYFEWRLLDPLDVPHATFSFHYRSWEGLRDLQLIPETFSVTDCGFSYAGSVAEGSDAGGNGEAQWQNHSGTDGFAARVSRQVLLGFLKKDVPVDEGSDSKFQQMGLRPATPPVEQKQKRWPMVHQPSRSNHRTQGWSMSMIRPKTEDEDEGDIPQGSISRKSSSASHAPSIAPSLLPYLDRELSSSPEPVLRVAISVPVHSPSRIQSSSQANSSATTLCPPGTSGSGHSSFTKSIQPISVRATPSPDVTRRQGLLQIRKSLPSSPGAQRFFSRWRKSSSSPEQSRRSLTPNSCPTEGEWLSQNSSPNRAQRRSAMVFRPGGNWKNALSGNGEVTSEEQIYDEIKERTTWL